MKGYKMANRCEDCCHWRREGETEMGQCRAQPPVIVPELVRKAHRYTERAYIGVWPTTTAEDWCGEFHCQHSSPS